jgi:hypothetical protein
MLHRVAPRAYSVLHVILRNSEEQVIFDGMKANCLDLEDFQHSFFLHILRISIVPFLTT